MAEGFANSELAVCAKRMPPRKLRIAAPIMLAAGMLFPAAHAVAQQYGPPSNGPSAAILFVPATLNTFAGFNPANGQLNGYGFAGDGLLANAATSQFSFPVGMAYDSNGDLFIADESNYVVRRIDAVTGDLSTFAGTPDHPGFSPTTGTATANSAKLGSLAGVVVDSNNNVYVADSSNSVVWMITPGGTISLFAGGATGSVDECSNPSDGLGDGCPATQAALNTPWALGVDAANNIYITDSQNDLIREVSSTTGTISIFAGVYADAGSFGSCNANLYSTSNGPFLPTQAHLCDPQGIAIDGAGNIYISDTTRNIVRIISKSTGYISTFAGTGAASSTGDGGPAVDATLNQPAGLYVDPAGRIYISEFLGEEIRVVDSLGNIGTVMGNSSSTLNSYSIGEPDTELVYNYTAGQYNGGANGIYAFAMDSYANIVAADTYSYAITSAGTTGQYYFGNRQIYQTVDTTTANANYSFYPPYVLISNPSGVTLNFAGPPVVNGPFAVEGGTCNFNGSLAPGASCTVIVSFTPTADQAYNGYIQVASNANSSPSYINLSGGGYGTCTYTASLTPSLSFTSPPIVLSATQAATLTNTGVCPISTNTSSAVFVNNSPSSTSAFTLVSTDCPATLNGGATCNFNVAFTPTALTGYSSHLQLTIPNYGNVSTSLSGTGITAPAVSFNPTTLTFPNTFYGNTANPMSTVLTNVGNAPLNNIVIGLAGTNPTYFAFSGTNNCPSTLAAGAFCTISVNFSPLAAVSNYSASISVADNATGTPQTVALIGTGSVAPPLIVINDSETIHTTDAPSATAPMLIAVNETVHTTDTPSVSTSLLVAVNETIQTTDAPSATTPLLIADNEIIHTTDAPSVSTSLLVAVNETIHTKDTPSATTPLLITDNETIHTRDTPSATTPLLITDNEIIHTTDSPSPTTPLLNNALLITDNEIIHTSDTPSLKASLLVAVNEIVHTSDAPSATTPLLIADNEIIHTTDTPLPKQATLVSVDETIHTKDTPAEQILTSPTTTTLTSSTATPAAGNPVTFTAKVSSSGGTPTGSVTFYDGATPLGAAALSSGTATFTTDSLSAGGHSISAIYAGTALFLTSTSNTLTETVTDFTLSFSSSGGPGVTLTILPGHSGTFTITITPPGNGYTGTITLSASGLPAGATATFSPNPVTLGGNHPATSTLTITIPASMGQAKPAERGPMGPRPMLLLGALLPLLGLRRIIKRNPLRLLAMVLFSICVCLGINGCGGNFYTQSPLDYVVTITATSGTVQHTTTIDLTVP